MEKSVRTAACLILGLAASLAATNASAQVVSAVYRPVSKTEAILGGSSALAAITAQQSGQPMPTPAAAPVRLDVAPASVFHQAVMSYAPVPTDRPDIFNSVALDIGHSPLDAKFRSVASFGAGSAATAFAASLRDDNVLAKLEAVNHYVNARVRFVDDRVQYGVADRWTAASQTLARGRGDCEDFAIAKRAMLRAAGVAERDLYLVVLKDLTRRADHAVLVVRANGRFLVLDNGTDRIVDSASVQDYRPILTFTQGKVWTHGYRRDTLPPVTYAALDAPKPAQMAEASVAPAANNTAIAVAASVGFSLPSAGF